MAHAEVAQIIRGVADKIIKGKNVVILTGAGISAESGIPTFRGAGGLWRNFSATQLATPEAFLENPALVWQFYEYRRNVVARCEPNAGHHALKRIEELLTTSSDKKGTEHSFALLTQNIDRLHHAAGSNPKNIVELHGSLWLVKPITHKGFLEEKGKVWEDRSLPICPALTEDVCTSDSVMAAANSKLSKISVEDLPHDVDEGILLRPAVVWFGESLDGRVFQRAFHAIAEADVLIIVGTSGVVQPAASFGSVVRDNGGLVVHFNIDAEAEGIHPNDVRVVGPSGETLPILASELEKLVQC